MFKVWQCEMLTKFRTSNVRRDLRRWWRWYHSAKVAAAATSSWGWRRRQFGRRRRISCVFELEGELEKKLLRLSIPIRPEFALAFVDFATRQLERDRLVRLAGEEEILNQMREMEEEDKENIKHNAISRVEEEKGTTRLEKAWLSYVGGSVVNRPVYYRLVTIFRQICTDAIQIALQFRKHQVST